MTEHSLISGKEFNKMSKPCDFYVTTQNEDDSISDIFFTNIRYLFDDETVGGTYSTRHKYIHQVEISDDAQVEMNTYCYKSNKLYIKKTWQIQDFITQNINYIKRMLINRHLFSEFDDTNHMMKYNLS
jgi:hypothetical protein